MIVSQGMIGWPGSTPGAARVKETERERERERCLDESRAPCFCYRFLALTGTPVDGSGASCPVKGAWHLRCSSSGRDGLEELREGIMPWYGFLLWKHAPPADGEESIMSVRVIWSRKRERWELPKGGKKAKDKCPRDTARRETLEEAGISVNLVMGTPASSSSWPFYATPGDSLAQAEHRSRACPWFVPRRRSGQVHWECLQREPRSNENAIAIIRYDSMVDEEHGPGDEYGEWKSADQCSACLRGDHRALLALVRNEVD